MSRTAIIAGHGGLPAALAKVLDEPIVAALDGFMPTGIVPDIVFRLERLALFLQELHQRGVERVIFAGAVRRPRLDPSLFDPATARLVPRLLSAMQGGDDATLRAVIGLFEEEGLVVEGVEALAPELVPSGGILVGTVDDALTRDADRATAIVAALGSVDVGQGAVVAQGLCLAVEALPGTDAMLEWVAATREGAGGVFYKAPKPGQDRRVDLPTLGVDTVAKAAAARLACIAWEAGGVILLDRDKVIEAAGSQGIALWAR
ncbi:LpxI family protein [Falsirhodobacter xinxiangensis]|uniref:LpxI family protein n=1 Tax=Falsirhodobacter xinxiangensis TaxID=2530049 RepID=UPI0010AB24AD|nr:UDP-2,3-diacylglucosamine diphosphatase LpxI [Rhodobacter xinxiangensis]